ncbi:MAG: hypothetical protein V2I67_11710 [Thermoanaerobaculales bacterium]|jgi:hypothetical protein|nr:hypothetical protein [Thermoanaerobaculales bacterium]
MTLESRRDLGHGVRVVPGDGGGVVVLSETVDLGWRPRAKGLPGSAVRFDGEVFEAVDRQPWGRGARWTLGRWSGEDVMRVVSPLDEDAVEAAAAEARTQARAQWLRPASWLLAPVLGFAATSLQRRWRDEWGFPASTATWLSAIIELLFGAVCLIEVIASVAAGAPLFPWIPRPLVFFGLYVFVEGFVRLAMVFSDSEPVGTLVGEVVSIFERRREPARAPLPGPQVEAFDEDEGALELRSPILRRDWESPGLLRFRGAHFELDGARRLGDGWIYGFRRVEPCDDDDRRLLRLPPPPKIEATVHREGHGLVATVLLSVACTIAPARFQQRWAWWVSTPAVGFTVAGSVVELIGGLANLGAGVEGLLVALNLTFVFEGVARLGWVLLKREPLGSLLGLPLIPVLDKALPE